MLFLPPRPLRIERCLQLFGSLFLSARGLKHGDVFDLRGLQATLQEIYVLDDLLGFVPQRTHTFREALRGLGWRLLRRQSFRRGDPGSVPWRGGRDLLRRQRDGLVRIGRREGIATFPVGTHGASRDSPGTGHPLRERGTALAFEFARTKHLAYACRGDPE